MTNPDTHPEPSEDQEQIELLVSGLRRLWPDAVTSIDGNQVLVDLPPEPEKDES